MERQRWAQAVRSTPPTTRTLAQVNRTAILEALQTNGPLTKQGIGAATGLSPATLNRLISTLQAESLIVPAGVTPSQGGRPSTLLRYSGRSRSVAALQLRADEVRGVLIDLDGEVLLRERQPLAGPIGAADVVVHDRQVDASVDVAARLIGAAERLGTRCLSVGVAVPGTVSLPEGIVSRSPELGWHQMPLKGMLEDRLPLPVAVENDANALAYGEMRRGSGSEAASIVALYLDRGFGAGIITNRELHRGARAEAGEVGYLLVERESLSRSYDEYGDLEDRIGPGALTRQAQRAGLPMPPKGYLTAEDVFRAAADGEQAAAAIADDILDMVSIALAALIIVVDPELIVVGSPFLSDGSAGLATLEERLRGRILNVPPIRSARFGSESVLVGAAALAAAAVSDATYL